MEQHLPSSRMSTPTREWIPLRNHPVFATINLRTTSTKDTVSTTLKPINVAAWDPSNSKLYLWDFHSLCLHSLSLRFNDGEPHSPDTLLAASPSKSFYPDNQLQFSVRIISINRQGSSLILAGASRLSVMYLSKRSTRKDGNFTCITVAVGSQFYSDDNLLILHVSWHPHSDTHFGVLTSDSVFRLFDLSSHVEKPEQEFYLQPVESNRYNNALSISPAAFCFGGEHLWDRFTVFFLFSDGSIYFLCPITPFGSFHSLGSIEELYREVETSGEESSNAKVVASSRMGRAWLEATFPEITDYSMEGSIYPALKACAYVPVGMPLILQGPLQSICEGGNGEMNTPAVQGFAIDVLYTAVGKDSFLLIAWSSGQLQVEAIADELLPLWTHGTSTNVLIDSADALHGVAMICDSLFVGSASIKIENESNNTTLLGFPPVMNLAYVDLALSVSAVNSSLILMLPDPLLSERIYCFHCGGVDLIVLCSFPFSDQAVGNVKPAKGPKVQPLLSACQTNGNEWFPFCGFVVLADPTGSSWVIGVTLSSDCIVAEVDYNTLAFNIDNDEIIEDKNSLENEPANIISKDLLFGPKAILLPQGSSTLCSLTPDSVEGRAALHHYIKLFHENYVEYGHKVYMELKHHSDHLKRIIGHQLARLEETRTILLKMEQRQPVLDNRINTAVGVCDFLEKRLQSFKILSESKMRPFSRAEHAFKSKLDYMESEIKALHSSIETLRSRLKKHLQVRSPVRMARGSKVYGQESYFEHLKSSLMKLSLVNSQNLEKVKLIESAIEK